MREGTGLNKQQTGKKMWQQLAEAQAKDDELLKDANRKEDSDQDDSGSSDDENQRANQWTFDSAIDVGSHFIDVRPDGELPFNKIQGGSFFAELEIQNPCKSCPLVFTVYTSSPINYQIVPSAGFIPALHSQKVRVMWEAKDGCDKDRLENTMFFIKGLPLDPAMDIELMKQNMNEVFNTYNMGILFCTHHLPAILKENQFNPQQMMQMQANQQARMASVNKTMENDPAIREEMAAVKANHGTDVQVSDFVMEPLQVNRQPIPKQIGTTIGRGAVNPEGGPRLNDPGNLNTLKQIRRATDQSNYSIQNDSASNVLDEVADESKVLTKSVNPNVTNSMVAGNLKQSRTLSKQFSGNAPDIKGDHDYANLSEDHV